MANVKSIRTGSDTGQTIYAVIRREADGFFLNDADGSFATAPADPFLSLAEHGTIKGFYTVSESRSIWTDGDYSVLIYSQTAGAPATASDFIIGSQNLAIKNDAEFAFGAIGTLIGVMQVVIIGGVSTAFKTLSEDLRALLISELGKVRAAVTSLQQSLLRGRK